MESPTTTTMFLHPDQAAELVIAADSSLFSKEEEDEVDLEHGDDAFIEVDDTPLAPSRSTFIGDQKKSRKSLSALFTSFMTFTYLPSS